MKFYVRTDADAKFSLERARFEADNIGRANYAVERLGELIAELPENPMLRFADGLIRLMRLGHGRAAYESFKKGYELAIKRPEECETARRCAFNAALLTADEEMFRCWVDLSIQAATPGDSAAEKDNQTLKSMMSVLNQGFTRVQSLMRTGGEEPGAWAGALEMALRSGKLASSQYPAVYRDRYMRLLKLDEQAMETRRRRGSQFPPAERLALQEAVRIIDRLLQYAPDNKEHLRMQTYALRFLERYEDCLKSAERSLPLNPGSLDCHVCKAGSLYRIGRREEGIAALDHALRIVKNPPKDEVEVVAKLRESMSKPYRALTDVSKDNDAAMTAGNRVGLIAIEELEWRTHDDVSIASILDRLATKPIILAAQPAKLYVPLVAYLLNDFTPETGFLAVRSVGTYISPASRYIFLALLYVAGRAEGSLRRDAADLLMYLVLACGHSNEEIREYYRQNVLAVGEFDESIAQCDSMIREALLRHYIDADKFLGKSQQVSDQERAKARKLYEGQFSGDPPQPMVGGIGWAQKDSGNCDSIFHKDTEFDDRELKVAAKMNPFKTDEEREVLAAAAQESRPKPRPSRSSAKAKSSSREKPKSS